MAKPDSTQDQTVEEILASIRQAISADDTRRSAEAGSEPKADPPKLMHERRPPSAGNGLAARGVGANEETATGSAPREAAPPGSPADRSQMHDVIEFAIEQALDGVGEAQAPATAPSQAPRMLGPPPRPLMRPEASQRPQADPRLGRELPRTAAQPPQRASLMSPRSNAAVATSFDDLAKAIAASTGRGLDQTVEDVLRPMLRSWLDDNLPPLVERLVREEIERVSRGRR